MVTKSMGRVAFHTFFLTKEGEILLFFSICAKLKAEHEYAFLNGGGMIMALEAAFIFLAPEADYQKDRSTIHTPQVNLTTVGVKDYVDAVKAATELEKEGIKAIELCGGFGVEGTAMIKRVLPKDVAVGVVRFDIHPGLDNKSGDDLFAL
jgi:hypothetical protein